MDNPFEILGIGPEADEEEIVQAYRQRVKQTHPDQGGSVDAFQQVKRAYEEIKNGDSVEKFALEYQRAKRAHEDGNVEDEETQVGTHIEYLNYEVLDDYGWGLHDDDLFENAAAADLSAEDYGEFIAPPNENVLKAAERSGQRWPFACRGGACANCAVVVVEGEMEMPSNHILSSEMMDEGVRLSCISAPKTDELKIVYNIKHLPGLDELRLPAQQVKKAYLGK
ncbi:ferredoxin Fer [Haloferax namakaokahaiae]|uniref:Ferredoxin Fer n=1 Tax=Haloferax namakaokahaiae TaxID=1748331 RepID=A0ABD5ZD79_9EURY